MTKHKDSKRYDDSKRYFPWPIWDLRGGGHVSRVRRPDAISDTPILTTWSPGAANRTMRKNRNGCTGWSPPSPMHRRPRQGAAARVRVF